MKLAILQKLRNLISFATALFNVYKTRVLADGGVVENKSCTIDFLDSIQ